MAGKSSAGYQDEAAVISDINVTPLVDVMLVLLIIFMVTAPMIAARGITVDKPKTVSGTQVPNQLTITIDKDHALYVNGSRASDSAAAQQLVAVESAKDPEVRAIIQADRAVTHGDVMEVIDMVTQAGVTHFALATARKETEKEKEAGK